MKHLIAVAMLIIRQFGVLFPKTLSLGWTLFESYIGFNIPGKGLAKVRLDARTPTKQDSLQ